MTTQQRRMLDKKRILERIARELAKSEEITQTELLQNLPLLNKLVTQSKAFPWNEVSTDLRMDRWRLYHWYYETFQRMLLGGVNKQDQQIIKDLIRKALIQGTPLSKQFQQHIKSQLSQEYHRSSFSISFNNQKRQVIKDLEKEGIIRPTEKKQPHETSKRVDINEVKRFIETANNEIKIRSTSVSSNNDVFPVKSPRVDQAGSMWTMFVPTMEGNPDASNKYYIELLQEPSSTTTEFLGQLNSKINNYQQDLSASNEDDREIRSLCEKLEQLWEQAQQELDHYNGR